MADNRNRSAQSLKVETFEGDSVLGTSRAMRDPTQGE